MEATDSPASLHELLRALDAMINADPNWGWDRPTTLMDIVWVGGTTLEFRIRDMFQGHPAEELMIRMPIKCEHLGLVLLCEGWRHSEAVAARAMAGEEVPVPSDCDDSTEIRVITVMLRNGETGAAIRDRGGDEPTITTEPLGGLVGEALQRTVRFV